MYNKKMLKVVIVGYGEMATSLMLGALEAGHKVVGVFRYDRVEYNPLLLMFKDVFLPSDFALLSSRKKIYDIKARSVNSLQFKKEILKLNPDVILVGSWGEKFSKEAIVLPKVATINCHPSLLPKHRGPNPYMSVIMEGEEKTGITFHLMNEKFDAGEILLQKEVPILFDDNGFSLKLRCCQTARKAVKELLDGLDNALFLPVPQKEEEASYYSKVTRRNIMINFSKSALKIYNKIRAFNPWLFCYISANNEFLKVKNARIISLNDQFFTHKNKKYNLMKFSPEEAGEVLLKGDDWLLVSTINLDKAILFEKVKLFGFFKQFFTSGFLKKLKKVYYK